VCDGKSVLQWLHWTNITDPAKPHADLLSVARYLMQQSGVKVDLHHVTGHQDSKHMGPFTSNPLLNIEANQLAKEKLTTYQRVPQYFTSPGARKCVIWEPIVLRKISTLHYAIISMVKALKHTGSSSKSLHKVFGQ